MALFVNSSWTGQDDITSWLDDGDNSAWLAENYAGTTLTFGTNAFGAFDVAFDKATANPATEHEICVLDEVSASVRGGMNYSLSDLSLTTGESGALALTVNGDNADSTGFGDISLTNISIGNGVAFDTDAPTVTALGTLVIAGSFNCANLSGGATVSVAGENSSLTVAVYSGSGNLIIGDRASVTITNYSGIGLITLDGATSVDITNITSGLPPSITIGFDPVTAGVLPYTELMTIHGVFDYVSAVGETDYNAKELHTVVRLDGGATTSSLYYVPKNYFYVNSNYGSSIPAILRPENATATVADAVTAAENDASAKIFVTGGTYGVDAGKAVAFNGIATQILGVETGSKDDLNEAVMFTSSVAGGECITNTIPFNWYQAAGEDTHLEINGGTYGKTTVGGDFVTQGFAYREGNTNLTINGGEFVSTVGGGMAYTPKNLNGKAVLTGNVNFTITGGTFYRRLYAGSISCTGYARTLIQGSVNLTIDASENVIAFKEFIVAGSFDNGDIDGDTNVTLMGNGDNLKTLTSDGYVAFNGTILGGSGASYFQTEDGVLTRYTMVKGSRNLAFKGFTGEFAGELKAFQNISFTDGAAVQFTNRNLKLGVVETWSIAFGSSVTATRGSNDFSGDRLSLDLTGWDAGSDWTVMSGTKSFFNNWDAFGSVTLGGQKATFADGKWTSTSYQLTLETSGNNRMLVLAAKV